jgi:hypothetical protein
VDVESRDVVWVIFFARSGKRSQAVGMRRDYRYRQGEESLWVFFF